MLDAKDATRPIVGIENRTGQEVFDIMCDRFRRALQAVGPEPAVAVKPLEWHKSRMPSWNDGHAMASVFGIEYRITRIWNGSKEQRMWWLVGTVTHDDWYATLESAKAAAEADYASRIRSALVATPPAEQHPDDIAVDRFAASMKEKLKWEREQRNRSGWQAMSAADLSRILYEHLPKGDPVDVANLSMMLHQNGQQIETPPAETVMEALRTEADNAYCRFLDKMSAPLCLGVEHKLETGKFGAAELNAHVDARELYGFHRGINHALAALAATEGQNG